MSKRSTMRLKPFFKSSWMSEVSALKDWGWNPARSLRAPITPEKWEPSWETGRGKTSSELSFDVFDPLAVVDCTALFIFALTSFKISQDHSINFEKVPKDWIPPSLVLHEVPTVASIPLETSFSLLFSKPMPPGALTECLTPPSVLELHFSSSFSQVSLASQLRGISLITSKACFAWASPWGGSPLIVLFPSVLPSWSLWHRSFPFSDLLSFLSVPFLLSSLNCCSLPCLGSWSSCWSCRPLSRSGLLGPSPLGLKVVPFPAGSVPASCSRPTGCPLHRPPRTWFSDKPDPLPWLCPLVSSSRSRGTSADIPSLLPGTCHEPSRHGSTAPSAAAKLPTPGLEGYPVSSVSSAEPLAVLLGKGHLESFSKDGVLSSLPRKVPLQLPCSKNLSRCCLMRSLMRFSFSPSSSPSSASWLFWGSSSVWLGLGLIQSLRRRLLGTSSVSLSSTSLFLPFFSSFSSSSFCWTSPSLTSRLFFATLPWLQELLSLSSAPDLRLLLSLWEGVLFLLSFNPFKGTPL